MIKHTQELESQINSNLINMGINPKMLENPAWDEQLKNMINDLLNAAKIIAPVKKIHLDQLNNTLYFQDSSLFGVKNTFVISIINPNKIEVISKRDVCHSINYGVNYNHNNITKKTIEFIHSKNTIKVNSVSSNLSTTDEKNVCQDQVSIEERRYSSDGILQFQKKAILPSYNIRKNYFDISTSEQLLTDLIATSGIDNLALESTTLIRDQIDIAVLHYFDKINNRELHSKVILNNYEDLVNMNFVMSDILFDILLIYPQEESFYQPYIQKVKNAQTREALAKLAHERPNYEYMYYNDDNFVCKGFYSRRKLTKKKDF